MIIALNNKSNLDKTEFENYKNELNSIQKDHNIELILCPTFLNLPLAENSLAKLGAQNVSSTSNGAYTGEISAEQLKSYNVEYCIVGHSERREYEKETNQEIGKKIHQLLKNNITPILCIGETLIERKNGQTKEILKKELISATEKLTESDKKKIMIAYEPIWSIGTGVIPTNAEIKEISQLIKQLLPNIHLLYGGSANEENIDTLKTIEELDGYLLGGLSLKINQLKIFIQKLKKEN